MNVILSIKPKYANQILLGNKTIEFRRSIFTKKVDKVYIYSTSPEKVIIAYFTIDYIEPNSPKILWDKFSSIGMISESDFFEYFKGKAIGYGIKISKVYILENPINPFEVIQNFVPPQSFKYIEDFDL